MVRGVNRYLVSTSGLSHAYQLTRVPVLYYTYDCLESEHRLEVNCVLGRAHDPCTAC